MAPQIRQGNNQNVTVAAKSKKPLPSMAEFYAGRKILITGVSGFIGKVLMEKALRSIPDCHLILLIRSKWGKSAQERVKAFTETPLFDRLKKEKPNALSERVTVIECDMAQPGLGLTPEDRKKIVEEVSVVYHLAALVRLEAPLRPAMQQNVHATRHLLDFCLEMKELVCVLHVSTAYCHPEVDVLEERLYPSDIFPKDVDDMLSWMSDEMVAQKLPKLLKQHPNCYTFTKRLAEVLVSEYVGRLPVTIVRPSIVTSSLHEPIPGWVDSLNGPVGIVVGAGKGVIRSLLCRKDLCAEIVPVDIAANALLIGPWLKAYHPRSNPNEVQVCNLTQHDIVKVPYSEVIEKGRKLIKEYPFDGTVWYPSGNMRESRLVHNTIVFCFQTVPAYIIDGILALAGQKTFLVRLQKRVLYGIRLLEYFGNRQWSFENHNGIEVTRLLSPEDRKIFPTADVEYDVDDYLKQGLLGARQYLMKEPLSTLPRARRQLKILWVVHQLAVSAFYVLVAWFFYRLFQFVTGRPVAWEV